MTTDTMSIAKTIVQQLRWGDSWRPARWAARDYVSLPESKPSEEIGKVQGGVMFKVSGTKNLKRGGKVLVYLTWADTYIVRIVRITGVNIKEIALIHDVYCDNLGEVIDRHLDG